jgi:hypothetical protein
MNSVIPVGILFDRQSGISGLRLGSLEQSAAICHFRSKPQHLPYSPQDIFVFSLLPRTLCVACRPAVHCILSGDCTTFHSFYIFHLFSFCLLSLCVRIGVHRLMHDKSLEITIIIIIHNYHLFTLSGTSMTVRGCNKDIRANIGCFVNNTSTYQTCNCQEDFCNTNAGGISASATGETSKFSCFDCRSRLDSIDSTCIQPSTTSGTRTCSGYSCFTYAGKI